MKPESVSFNFANIFLSYALQFLDSAIHSNLSESTTKILASLTPRE